MTDVTVPEVLGPTAEFPFEWGDPSDAGKTWEWDDMHMPTCVAPLAGDYALMIVQGDRYSQRRLDLPFEFRGQVFNGYVYYVSRHDVPADELEASRARASAAFREQIPLAADYWRKALVELQEMFGWIARLPVESLPLDELADAWDAAWERALRAWEIHFYIIIGPYESLDVLADLYESVMPDAPSGEALRLTQGTIHELTAVDDGLTRLAVLASNDALAAALSGGRGLENLADVQGGPAFVEELSAFLDRHGHLGQNWDDLALPSWAEEPSRLLSELSKRIEHPPEPARVRAERLRAEAEALADAFRARVADDPAKLAEFERALADAREIGHLTETHNYWIDRLCQARLRALAFRVGARLAQAGVFAQPDDVLYLHRDEITALLRRPEDRQGLVASRRADRARWSLVRPPSVLGAPKRNEEPNRFGGDTTKSKDDRVIRGTGASGGVVRGPARVVLGPDDFAKVGPGDVIIAPSSNPSWVPLFTIAAGLVTNTGGVLSHAAVVAREFALPAVVGTGDATRRITDGQIVELDGTTGVVRLA
ncbi:MAG TPA: PEP-utilizing enzyme [Candidatus Limnocylindrales bacterium]|nr:PEP-utilizing enzyme [Candidatus Limnocylindrales bacterium]